MAVQFLRRMVGISFFLGTLALTWYASNMYRRMRSSHHGQKEQHHQQQEEEEPNQSLWDVSTTIVYALGLSWWIITGFLAYLVPLLVKGGTNRMVCCSKGPSEGSNQKNIHKSSDRSRKLIYWFLVVAPSLWVYAYATYGKIPRAKERIRGETSRTDDDPQETPTTFFEWIEILVMASALPTGTAGMMSMGIYVFGTVAKHSPLWSAYVVLPANEENNNGHANLMKDALRLHQWAGYVTFVWFLLHTILYCIIYGVAGVQEHFRQATNVTLLGNINASVTENATDSRLPSTAALFWGAMWTAIIPPSQCRPILGWWGNFNSNNETTFPNTNQTKNGRERQLYRVLFEEEAGSGHEEHAAILNASITNDTMNASDWQDKLEHDSTNGTKNLVNATASSSSKFTKGTGHENGTKQEGKQEGKQKEDNHCYGYYRNFNGFLAILSVIILVLTSLTFVRRKNYRFFYVSHIVTAILFLVTMILHMRRIGLYLMPSLVLYFATTIPTWIESLAAALFDGGVNIVETTVLRAKNQSVGDNNGVVDLSFLVETDSGEAKEAVTSEHGISHRPKSVRICVPSISLLWYPFTVIEPCDIDASKNTANGTKTNLVRYKVLFGTVGYFTKSLWKRLYELEQIKAVNAEGDTENPLKDEDSNESDELTERDDFFDDEDLPGESELPVRKLQKKHILFRKSSRDNPPLILVDGFYSGAADWIENARQHDFVLVAAGGTGVTPFLTFVPKLLQLLQQADSCNNLAVSFLWCCRDEALIEHVLTAYLLPLFRTTLHQETQHDNNNGSSRFRLMIYNTSRDCSDSAAFELISKKKAHSKSDIVSRGVPMKPSRLQHHPFSSRTRVVAGTVTFLSISLMGVGIHLWSNQIVSTNKHLFSVRLYGLFAILAWACLVGILTEATCRVWSAWSLRHSLKGYTIANKIDHKPQNSTYVDGEDGSETTGKVSFDNSRQVPTSLVPGRIYSEEQNNLVLDLSLSNGRPILEYKMEPDDDNERGEDILSPSEATLRDMVMADQPGVFYCGPQSLMEVIQSRVDTARKARPRRGLVESKCIFYEESFEM